MAAAAGAGRLLGIDVAEVSLEFAVGPGGEAGQMTDLLAIKPWLQQHLLARSPRAGLPLVDRFRVPVCQLAGASRCRRFRGQPDGKDTLIRQARDRFRVQVRWCGSGVTSRVVLAPANISEPAPYPRRRSTQVGSCSTTATPPPRLWPPSWPRTGSSYCRRWAERVGTPRRSGACWCAACATDRGDTVIDQLVERYHASEAWGATAAIPGGACCGRS